MVRRIVYNIFIWIWDHYFGTLFYYLREILWLFPIYLFSVTFIYSILECGTSVFIAIKNASAAVVVYVCVLGMPVAVLGLVVFFFIWSVQNFLNELPFIDYLDFYGFLCPLLFILFAMFIVSKKWAISDVVDGLIGVCLILALNYWVLMGYWGFEDCSVPDTAILYNNRLIFNGYIAVDFYSSAIKCFLLLFSAYYFWLVYGYIIDFFGYNKRLNFVEFPIIAGFAIFFMLLLVSSFNLFGAYVCLEGITFSLYILAGLNHTSQNALESSIKYFCLGSLASGLLLLGIAIVFLITQTLDFLELRFFLNQVTKIPLFFIFSLVFIFSGFWFKLSVFPCHTWTPDVYEGVFTPVTLFFATIVKLSIFSFLARIFYILFTVCIIIEISKFLFLSAALGSIVYGALGALLQTKLKRFIGYTAINQMGFLLLGLSCGTIEGLAASFFFLFFYLIMSFSFFSVLLYSKDIVNSEQNLLFINQLRFLGESNKPVAFFMALILFSMAGIPPFAGFFGKLHLLFALFQTGNFLVVIVVLFVNVISVFYYLRLIKCMFFEKEKVKALSYTESGGGKYLIKKQPYFFNFYTEKEGVVDGLLLSSWVNAFILIYGPFYKYGFIYLFSMKLANSCTYVWFF